MEKTAYELRCDGLIQKYGLVRTDFIDSVQIHSIILELFQKRCLAKRIVLWGAGYNNSLTSHASILLTKYATCLQGVVCLTDSCKELQGKDFMGFPIIPPEELPDWDVDVVIISSRSSAESIKESLHAVLPDCESIDLYQELRDQGIDIPYNFYEERNFYTELYDVRTAYETAPEQEKPAQLWKLIASYLHIRDFYYAFLFIGEYIQKEYEGQEQLAKFQEEMQQLLEEVAAANEKRSEDVIVHFFDALRAVDVFGENGRFHILQDFLEQSVAFTQMYSTAPTTYESFYSIFTGKLPYTENVYENRFIFQPEESPLVQEAWRRGCQFNLFSSAEWRIIHEHERVNYIDQIHMADKLWKMACLTAESKTPCFNFLYYPWELHFPLLCGFHHKKPVAMGFKDVGIVDMSDFIGGQHADCLDYVDRQMDFFGKILPDKGYSILFSDHSQIVHDPEKCLPFFCYYKEPDRATHCVLAIRGPGIQPRQESSLLSMADFNRIALQFLWDSGQGLPVNQVIQYQYYSVHNKRFRDLAIQKGLTDYMDGIRCYLSEEFLYAITRTGREEVFRAGQPDEDVADTPDGAAFIRQVSRDFDRGFPEFLEIHY